MCKITYCQVPDLSWISEIHMVEGKNKLPQIVFGPPQAHMSVNTHTYKERESGRQRQRDRTDRHIYTERYRDIETLTERESESIDIF